MKAWEVWSEGYAATGEYGLASFFGVYHADTFKQAIEKWVDEEPSRWKLYDPDRLTFWGCKFYDNEKDARAFFG